MYDMMEAKKRAATSAYRFMYLGATMEYMKVLTTGQNIRLAEKPRRHLSLNSYFPASILSLRLPEVCRAPDAKRRVNWMKGIMQAWGIPTGRPIFFAADKEGKTAFDATRVRKK